MRRAIGSVVVLLAVATPSRAKDCPPGLTVTGFKTGNADCGNSSNHCVVSRPTIINVFWDDDEDRWNKDIKATDETATAKRIDTAMQAIVKSAYMWPLQQYWVSSPSTRPYIVEGHCGPVPATADDAWANKLGPFTICMLNRHSEIDTHTVLNVFVPPRSLAPSSNTFCHTAGARHGSFAGIAVAFIPTNSNCSGDIREIVGTATHEMVEAATDPNPGGVTGFQPEIGDACECDKIYRTNFIFGGTHAYWSDSKKGCTNGSELVKPNIPGINKSTSSVCGTGHDMRFEIRGDLPTAPWDLDHGHGGDRTLFLHAQVGGSHSWGAGDFRAFVPDIVGLGNIEWNDDRIIVHGFDDAYGSSVAKGAAFVAPGDSIEFSVSSWATGRTNTIKFTAPLPKKVDGFKVDSGRPFPVIGDNAPVTGRLVDGGDCGIGDANITIHYNVVPFTPGPHPIVQPVEHKLVALEDGRFDDNWLLDGTPGTRTVALVKPVAQTWKVDVHPDAQSLSSTLGDRAGGRTVTITGAGFTKGVTTVSVKNGAVSMPGTNVQILSSTQLSFVTPTPQPNHDDVTVLATVNLLDSPPLSYRYITPLVPDLHSWAASCKTGELDSFVEADVYDADGNPLSGNVTLSAKSGVFLGGATTTSVAAGGVVGVKGGVKITAVSSQSPTAASITPPAVHTALPFCPLNSHIYKIYATHAAYGGGPVESIVLPAVLGDTGNTISWSADGGAWARATQLDATSLARARTMVVHAVGSEQLAAAVRDRPPLLAAGAGKALRLGGPALSVGAPASGAAPTLTLTLPVPSGRDPASLRMVHQAANGAWSIQTTRLISSPQGSQLQATVSDPGLYALATVE
jgi:IPT/TIG domain